MASSSTSGVISSGGSLQHHAWVRFRFLSLSAFASIHLCAIEAPNYDTCVYVMEGKGGLSELPLREGKLRESKVSDEKRFFIQRKKHHKNTTYVYSAKKQDTTDQLIILHYFLREVRRHARRIGQMNTFREKKKKYEQRQHMSCMGLCSLLGGLEIFITTTFAPKTQGAPPEWADQLRSRNP